uniref:uncharacterized protein LOC105349343 n=1 Tax=Fragaria vesca subsp. vesca TaxID=101020 RepID=UPI0005C817E0|nr:PREDICTED: uncharacterized protein LOC105349343 [Fragaria vesca subsp. vesca]
MLFKFIIAVSVLQSIPFFVQGNAAGKLWSLVERQSRLDRINLRLKVVLCVQGGYIFLGAYAIQEAQLFHVEKTQANRTDVEDQPPVTSIPAFTRCCQGRLEKQFNTEIKILSHLHHTIVIKAAEFSFANYILSLVCLAFI